ncbi:hypothetical protein [Ralstonia sp.]|uniref:hypothetical protein n=1 Tax=Ralstonia sp. TaxID=54061 RepID=UPI002BEF12CA|nr:hypothetical protein [Ralstonia sp.]HWV02973.1 hypothetical protein [Ralstonia sp.]
MHYHPRTTHSVGYYASVLLALHDAILAGLTHQQTAATLNEKQLLSPRGKPWTMIAVRKALWKLRHSHDEPSKLHAALMKLVFSKAITREQAMVLVTPSPVL